MYVLILWFRIQNVTQGRAIKKGHIFLTFQLRVKPDVSAP